jgi:hypothetical protein
VDADSPIELYSSHRDVCNCLIAAINESSVKNLFDQGDGEKLGPNARSDVQELRRGIRDDRLKVRFLGAILLSTRATLAVSLLKKRIPEKSAGYVWQDLVNTIRSLLPLAPISADLDLEALSRLNKKYRSAVRSFYHQNGLKIIDIYGAVTHAEFDAWEMLLSVPRLPSEAKIRTIQAGATKLRQVLEFLSTAQRPPWKVVEVCELPDGLTHLQIMRELRQHHLKAVDSNHKLFSIEPGFAWNDIYSFSLGTILKKDYVFCPLGVDSFATKVTSSIVAEWEADPIQYIYGHLGGTDTSAHVTRIQLELEKIDEIILGLKLQNWMMHTAEELSPEFVALGIAEWCHLPHVCTPFLTALLHRLFRLLRRK